MFGYAESAIGEVAGFLTDFMDVYEVDDKTGGFDTRVASQVACNLAPMNANTAPSAALRAELLARRVLAYDATIKLGRGHQVEINGERWNPVSGTNIDARSADGQVIYRRCDVEFERATS